MAIRFERNADQFKKIKGCLRFLLDEEIVFSSRMHNFRLVWETLAKEILK